MESVPRAHVTMNPTRHMAQHALAPTTITEEVGNRAGTDEEHTLMVDCALRRTKL